VSLRDMRDENEIVRDEEHGFYSIEALRTYSSDHTGTSDVEERAAESERSTRRITPPPHDTNTNPGGTNEVRSTEPLATPPTAERVHAAMNSVASAAHHTEAYFNDPTEGAARRRTLQTSINALVALLRQANCPPPTREDKASLYTRLHVLFSRNILSRDPSGINSVTTAGALANVVEGTRVTAMATTTSATPAGGRGSSKVSPIASSRTAPVSGTVPRAVPTPLPSPSPAPVPATGSQAQGSGPTGVASQVRAARDRLGGALR
jgi:hypothetical protein